MKKLFYLLMVLLLAACGSDKTANISSDTSTSKVASSVKIDAQFILSQMEKGKYKEGELLVKFKSGVVTASSLKLHQAVGTSVIKRFTIVPNLERVKLPQGLSVKDAITQYMSDPDVEYAEPNYIRCASSIPSIPNDTYFGNQWGLNNTGTYASGTADADIDAPEAWDISKGSSSIVVAVLDTGIDYNHSDLVGNMWMNTGESSYTNGCADEIDNDENGFVDDCKGWDFTRCEEFEFVDEDANCIEEKSQDNDPMDEYGHGTHVAGIIGAVGNNGAGVSGVMWNVKLMAVRFLNAQGYGTEADEIEAIEYAVNKGAKIINASYGGYEFSSAEYDAISEAHSAGVLFVAAAGNEENNNDMNPAYPASYNLPNVISVASTNQNDMRTSFSNYGLSSVHVAAPGEYIFSTVPVWWSQYEGYGVYEYFAGTSMAAPHVSGLAGLLYSYYDGIYNTQFDYSQIRTAILRMVDVLPTLSGWIETGGRINAYKALSFLRTPTNLTASAISSTQISLSWADNATGEDGYRVERKIGEGTFTEISESPLLTDSSSFTDSGLTPGTTYAYRIRAYNDIAESFWSDEKSATTPVTGSSSGGSGGGCSIGAKKNKPTAFADMAVMLMPLFVIIMLKNIRRKKK